MAQRLHLYPEGTPERRVQDAVKAKYEVFERFFLEIAEELNIQPDTASSTFYALLRSGTGDSTRAIPQRHADIYATKLKDDGITPEVIMAIEAKRSRPSRPQRRDHLAELEAQVAWLISQLARCAEAIGIELEPLVLPPSSRSGDDHR